MAYYKEAASRAERPYVESEAPSYNSTVDQFFREYYTIIRLPEAYASRARWISSRQRALERDFPLFIARVEEGASVSMGNHSFSLGAQVNGSKSHAPRALTPESLHSALARGSAKAFLNRLAAQSGKNLGSG
jgi:hypothetical protein